MKRNKVEKIESWRRQTVSGLRGVSGTCSWRQMTCSSASAPVAWSSNGTVRWHFRAA